MNAYTLEIELLSDTTFAAGGGVTGMVDIDVQHDEFGLPTASGRALKGLLVNECSEILYPLPPEKRPRWEAAALRLFGRRGEMADQPGGLWIGDAAMPPDLIAAVRASGLPPADVLDSLTAGRVQTSINELGAPRDETLRATRVILRGVTLYAPLWLDDQAGADDRALLAACVMALRRAGLGRTRGKGKITARITERKLDPQGFIQTANASQKDLARTAWFKPFEEGL